MCIINLFNNRELPLKDSLAALFIDLGIDNIISESCCPISLKRIDKEIIKKAKEEYRLLRETSNFEVKIPEFVSKKGIKYKFISAYFDNYRIIVSFEIITDDGPIIKDAMSVWELRSFMGLDIPSAIENEN